MKWTKERLKENDMYYTFDKQSFQPVQCLLRVRFVLQIVIHSSLTFLLDFLQEIMIHHLEKEKSKIVSLENIHVFEGPNISSISVTLSVRFDLTFLPDYNIEEKKKVKIFVKIPVFDEPNQTAVKLCNKEIKVYSELFTSLKAHLDHPIKGPHCGPQPQVLFMRESVSQMSGPSVLGK